MLLLQVNGVEAVALRVPSKIVMVPEQGYPRLDLRFYTTCLETVDMDKSVMVQLIEGDAPVLKKMF